MNSTVSFMPVPLATLRHSSSLSVDLYLKPEDEGTPVLYREQRLAVDPEDFDRLAVKGIRVAYIPSDQVSDYQKQLQENLDDYIKNPEAPAGRRYEFLNEAVRGMLSKTFDNGNTDAVMEVVDKVGDKMVTIVEDADLAASNLHSILRHDYQTFTHSFNVSSFAVLLAKELGISDPGELKEIAVGGLVHDLGKLKVPSAILNKNGRLNQKEREIIERHPTDGYLELAHRDDMSEGQLMMVYQHHEKLDGTGYPVGVVGDEIHYLGRLCAVVDIFEAMTSNRPYRKSIPIPEVLVYLDELSSKALDPEMVKCWKSAMTRKI